MYNVYPQRSLPTIPLSPLPRKCNSIVRSRTFQGLMFARFIVGPSQQPRSQKGWWWLGLPVFISSHPQNICVYGRESVKRRFFFFSTAHRVDTVSHCREPFVASASVSSMTFLPLYSFFLNFTQRSRTTPRSPSFILKKGRNNSRVRYPG